MAWQNLVSENKIVQLACATTNGGITSDVVSLKNAIRATIICNMEQAVGHATLISLKQATDVAAGTNAAGPACPIWVNADTTATDTLVKETTDAATFTLGSGTVPMQVIFEVDPAALTAGYDCVYVTVADSSQATNFAAIEILIRENYQRATPPAAITD